MDRPDEDPKPRSSVGRDIDQGAVCAPDEYAGANDPPQKLEAPPGPDSHGVPPRQSTPVRPLVSTPLAQKCHPPGSTRAPASTNVARHGTGARLKQTSLRGVDDFERKCHPDTRPPYGSDHPALGMAHLWCELWR